MQAVIDIRHIMRVERHHRPSDIESCSTEIGQYLADHDNWPQPIFPNVVDCSPLIFEPEHFDITGQYWNCNDQLQETEEGEQAL